MLVKTSCNFCNSEDNISLTEVVVSPITENSRLVQCKKCGLAYINPRPTIEREKKFYDGEYFKPEEETLWGEDKLPLFNKVLSRIESTTTKGSLLDVGCGKGYFMEMARKRGWKVTGVDISSTAVQFAKNAFGLNVCMGELRGVRLPENSFDVATAWNVLDQMYDPWGNLLEIFRMLRRGGLIALRVSNLYFHLYLQRLFDTVNFISPGGIKIKVPLVFHLYMFSPETLSMFLREAGFVGIKIENSTLNPNVPALLELVGKPGEVLLRNTVHFLAQSLYYLSVGNLLVGPSLVAYARKP